MKNAYVTDQHIGDNGAVTEGMILEGITQKRFDALEKKGLVREATPAEVKEGFKPPFIASGTVIAGEGDEGGEKDAPGHKNKKAGEPESKGA